MVLQVFCCATPPITQGGKSEQPRQLPATRGVNDRNVFFPWQKPSVASCNGLVVKSPGPLLFPEIPLTFLKFPLTFPKFPSGNKWGPGAFDMKGGC